MPEGYQLSENLALPKAYAYLSVQERGYPQINTYSMPVVDLVEFPMLMAGFSAEELQNVQVYIRKNKGSYQKLDRELAEVTSKGIQLYCREIITISVLFMKQGVQGFILFHIMMNLL